MTDFLTAVFFLVGFAVGAIEVVILFGSPIISITGGVVALVLLAVLIVTLNLACLMCGNSVIVRDLWKWKIQKSCDTKYLRKVLKSLNFNLFLLVIWLR